MVDISGILTGRAAVSEAVRGRGARESRLLRSSPGCRPVVVWNAAGRCNPECGHSRLDGTTASGARCFTTGQGRAFIDDLAAMGVAELLFSGGEPLLRPDLCELAAHASARGLRPSLSTNGALITPEAAERLKASGVASVAVSIDGAARTHDAFRNRRGAFDDALRGLKNAARAGLLTGVRFTLCRRNARDLAGVLHMVESEGVGRFCMHHLVYAGRGGSMIADDVTLRESRGAVEMLMDAALDWNARGVDAEILTADNSADGVLLLRRVEEREPRRADHVRSLLETAGGCGAGRRIACVDSSGDAHPCQFWRHESIGNVLERGMRELWRGAGGVMKRLRTSPLPLAGRRCGACRYKGLCGGCRIRALAAAGDVWGDDPHCYLTDDETGIA